MSEMPAGTQRRAEGARSSEVQTGNLAIASKLRGYADLLDQQNADGFRARAYRRAADTVAGLDHPIEQIFLQEGREGLIALPTIGTGIASAIAEILVTGRWSQFDRLRGELDPEALFRTLPGIGPKLARRLAEDGELETLEQLEHALHIGGLKVGGIGPRRRMMIAAVLRERLGRPPVPQVTSAAALPPVSLLLEVDRLYREMAAAEKLRTIAPKRFNPDGEAWLPILHARRGRWHFTALFSNTRLAHQLDKTRDWVVIYAHADGWPETRCTVVTEVRGERAGQRVVRGRESDRAEGNEVDMQRQQPR